VSDQIDRDTEHHNEPKSAHIRVKSLKDRWKWLYFLLGASLLELVELKEARNGVQRFGASFRVVHNTPGYVGEINGGTQHSRVGTVRTAWVLKRLLNQANHWELNRVTERTVILLLNIMDTLAS
jgi:hypothetical protein